VPRSQRVAPSLSVPEGVDELPAYTASTQTEAIQRIRELLPDYGPGFLQACLDFYGENEQIVINHLLEGELDPSLEALPKDMPLGSNLLASRQNIFVGDEFDVFAGKTLDPSKVHMGKKDQSAIGQHVDSTLKQSILQRATATSDDDDDAMYNDEYDDTYDDVDRMTANDAQSLEETDDANERLLVQATISQPQVFARNTETKRSAERVKLRQQTGMTDEQLEGWYVMFQRNVSFRIGG
jgi:hypothetical protein